MDHNEVCSLCHEPLTVFGSFPIADGIICKHCARKLSPWLRGDQIKEKTLEQIERHLIYRRNNYDLLVLCEFECKVEGKYSLYIDRELGVFSISKREDLLKENTDVFFIEDILTINAVERKDENGLVNVYMVIDLEDEEIERIVFRVNEFNGIEKDSEEYQNAIEQANQIENALDALKEEVYE